MRLTGRGASQDVEAPGPTELEQVANQLAKLRGEVRALRDERDHTQELRTLREEKEILRIENGRVKDENARAIKTVEHETGLLRLKLEQEKTAQRHEVEHARRMAQVEVREQNLDADKTRFAEEVTFQREQMQSEMTRLDGILTRILERLPEITVELSGGVGTKKTAARKED